MAEAVTEMCRLTMRQLHVHPVGGNTVGLDEFHQGVDVDSTGLDHLSQNKSLENGVKSAWREDTKQRTKGREGHVPFHRA